MVNTRSIQEELSAIKSSNRLAKVHRDSLEEHSIDGFIIDFTEQFCLIQYFFDFFLDGYRIIRINDISSIKSGEVEAFFTRRAIALGYTKAGGQPPSFDISLDSWPELLQGIQHQNLHVALHEEVEYPEALQVGELMEITEDEAILKTYSTIGEWDEYFFTQELDKLTQVQFGDRYIKAFQTFTEESA